MRHVIALDVGGTAMKGALVGADGALLHRDRRPTARERGTEAVIGGILDFAADLRSYGVRHLGEPALASGLAVPGIIDETSGVAVYAANLGWRDVPLRDLLATRTGTPAALGHDVRTGGLAEGRLGAARETPRFLFLALGTGIAGAIGTPTGIDPGAHGSAGEIGHIVVRPGGAPCPCGQRGCLERYASAAAVTESWARASGDPTADAADCAKAVEAGDPRAAKVWHQAVTTLADGLMTALTLLDPTRIVIGGGLAESGDTLFTPLREAIGARVTFQHPPEIVPATLGDTAGCLGAGLMAWDLLKESAGMEETP
ncbi:ROK family protein [Streptomyces acidiscabies]|uniref:ROK family protein n=1 Tax=Streptomyces acidiscabies TaxID=42234 RepID=A0AAP6EHP4_9ACTN|nr:ROK family protein [Streptomyces acidiscabies]MBP5938795.1 ROK family protein [Streptomyces sp. LBUM 1476]MBZ3909908.1 ROK family protein [Streptomyces acidiscabies]MDX2962616.1 ROK family protein [Streptomyces acidiscabies]MDX3020529.1 ROK family protein [Streptomyces acidiscabies]MDX3789997.1 ROK family protein [Streptomyces acidiscabies]